MSSNDNNVGKALLVIGGVVLTGIVINEILDDGPTRESHRSTSRKKRTTKKPVKLFSSKKERQRYIVETLNPRQSNKDISSGDPKTGSRKYSDSYYSLSKSQQYNYRQKLARDLIQISKEK